ncbi:MAG: amidase family protein [Sphingomonas sp.]
MSLMHWSTHQSNNPIYGRTRNPADPGRTPGGSSGGAAAAWRADGGGRARLRHRRIDPRAGPPFTGIWGHKPTFGALDLHGHDFPGDRRRRAADGGDRPARARSRRPRAAARAARRPSARPARAARGGANGGYC